MNDLFMPFYRSISLLPPRCDFSQQIKTFSHNRFISITLSDWDNKKMNILSESLLSNTQEQCHNCEYYEKEFAVLKKKLALSYASIDWLENLETIRG